MATFSYSDFIEEEQTLTPAALTVRIQSRPYNDQGQLIWDQFFPRVDVPSVRINQITTLDFRPVSNRREWNTRGRLVTPQLPKLQRIEMLPIEADDKIGEREVQAMTEQTFGNMELFRQLAGIPVPGRIDALSVANMRRMEVDAMQAWTQGTITVFNPDTGATHTVSYNIDPTRYTVASPAWNAGGQNTYTDFLNWLYNALLKVGDCVGVMLRRTTMEAIRAFAPNPLAFNSSVPPGIAELEVRIAAELGLGNFTFFVNERTVDTYNGTGLQTTRTNIWPVGYVAAIPAGVVIGDMAFAPISRAWDLARNNPTAGIDVNGSVAWLEPENGGRGLQMEVQTNALPIPNEQKIYVVNAGV